MRDTAHAPGRLELVREFVNTLDIEEDTDELDGRDRALAWLRSRELVEEGATLSAPELERLVAVREALRELLLATNAGEAPPERALAVLNENTEEVTLRVRFEPDGTRIAGAGGGAAAALGELLAAVHAAIAAGTWERLKVCPAPDCHWAFYDRSRNRSATWCRMGECGNRNKARAFRARRRGG
jgi:predicted RNA-binding Zn ribbon-like protein